MGVVKGYTDVVIKGYDAEGLVGFFDYIGIVVVSDMVLVSRGSMLVFIRFCRFCSCFR